MSRLSTTIDQGQLHNPHAGEMLAGEFMEPLNLDALALATAIDVRADQIEAVVHGKARVDAALDLRLARYFGLSEGFFLRLQNSYEIVEAKRRLNGELDRIVPRAA